MKTVISFAPVVLLILLIMLNNITKGVLGAAIFKFLTTILGFTSNNPFIAATTFLVGSAAVFGLCYMLIRRISIKD
jgi:hypothetical protein